MPLALAILFGFQLLGEVLRRTLHLALPGPLIGMFLLAVALVVRGHLQESAAEAPPTPLVQTANGLIAYMGLLFVPAGVGIVAETGVLQQQWLPILAGLLVSTVLGLIVTGLVMHHVSRATETRRRTLPDAALPQEAR
jgi:holin-like protein